MASAASSNVLQRFREAGGDPRSPGVVEALEALRCHAPAVLELATTRPALLYDVLRAEPRAPIGREDVFATWDRLLSLPIDELGTALREARHRALIRIALREAWEEGDVRERAAEWSDVAEACVRVALSAARRIEEACHGPLLSAHGTPSKLVALGMGKLAGRELNLGSDVDLCFFFDSDEGANDETSLFQRVTRIVRHAVRLIGEVTPSGFCFRVDLRLRPEGRSGPLANSLAAAERYYETWGRPWERAVLLRARPIAGDLTLGTELLRRLEPFVFPRRVDPRIVEELASMLARSRLGTDAWDIKLGTGGIREAEFFVQGLQLVWGGRHPRVRTPGTLEALHELLGAGFVTEREARSLRDAWLVLRRVEHRIHLSVSHPSHRIPEEPAERERLARSLGHRSFDELNEALRSARHDVERLFASIRPSGTSIRSEGTPFALLVARLQEGSPPDEASMRTLLQESGGDLDEARAHLLRLARRADGPLGTVTVARHPDFATRLLHEVSESADPIAALRGLASFFSRCGPPLLYVHLLKRSPRALRRLIALLGASPSMTHLLVGHPESLDALLARTAPPSPKEIQHAHARELPPTPRDAPPEVFVSVARNLRREFSLAVGMAYANGELEARSITSPLTALAEAQLRAALRYASVECGLAMAESDPEPLALIGLGKLGSAEMGFGSDLDVFFVHAPGTDPKRAVRAAQRTLRLLTVPDPAGPGYRIDTRLRPSGNHGMLVVSSRAFRRYHERSAAAWERLALLQARTVAGGTAIRAHVEGLLRRIPFERPAPTAAEIAAIRRRIQCELAVERPDRYHPKLGFGALLDLEFLIQMLHMRLVGSVPAPRPLRRLLGDLVEASRLDPSEAARLEAALQFFQSVLQAIRFHDPIAEPFLRPGGLGAERVARRLGLRPGARSSPGQRLVARWKREATYVRARFEHHLGPVGASAPWSGSRST